MLLFSCRGDPPYCLVFDTLLCDTFRIVRVHCVYTYWVCGKRGAQIWSIGIPGRHRQHPLVEIPWGLLALCRRTLGSECIDTQLRDLMNLGLTRWRLALYVDAVAENGRNPVSKISPDSAWVWRMDRLTRDGTGRTHLARPNSRARTGIGKYSCPMFSWRRVIGLATFYPTDGRCVRVLLAESEKRARLMK